MERRRGRLLPTSYFLMLPSSERGDKLLREPNQRGNLTIDAVGLVHGRTSGQTKQMRAQA
jgi:hypothetical protein